MSRRNWGSGDVVSRRVGANIEEILPASLSGEDTVHFTAYGAMRQSVLPPEAVGGVLELTGVVGERSQFELELTATMQRRTDAGDDVDSRDWTVETTFYRTESQGSAELDPFRYYVEWRERDPEHAESDAGIVSLSAVGDSHRYGRREGLAALLLIEIVANRKASAQSDRRNRVSHAGSLAMLGSFNSAVDAGRIPGPDGPLDWETADALLGPDAETLAARTSVRTAVPETQRRAARKGQHLVPEDDPESAPDGSGEAADANPEARLGELLQEIEAMDPEIEAPPILASPDRVASQRDRLEDRLRDYPDGFPGALRAGNFGIARRRAADAADPYEKMVLLYAFYELYGIIGQLQESEQAVRQIASAITAFGRAVTRGNEKMAELSLTRASEAFVTVTKRLLEGAQSDLEDLRSLLAYHQLADTFDRYLASREELGGSELAHYEQICAALVESARRQHERAEKAREAFYRFTDTE
ncbi:MAG: hypothetical protein ABEJ60_08110 [Halodesulfurarchaeum sp.]